MLSRNKIKYLQTLQNKKNRQEAQFFVVEGKKILIETLESDVLVEEIFCTEEFFEENKILFLQKNIMPSFATPEQLAQCGNLETNHAGIAVLPFFEQNNNTSSNFFPKKDELILVLDTIQDPGNLGTILRIADWFGIKKVICSEDCVEIYNPKVLGATMGAFLRVKVYYTHLETFFKEFSKQKNNENNENEKDIAQNINIMGAILEGGISVIDKKMSKTGFLIMGNESKGISKNLYPYITEKLFIPRFGEAESLNVGTATAIFCYEWRKNFV